MSRRTLNFALAICALSLILASSLLAQQQQQGPFRLRVVPSNGAVPQGALRTYYIERFSLTGKSNGILNFGAQWTSSNPAVASIDPNTGILTAVAQGTATITAKSGPFRGATQITVTPIALIAIAVTANGQPAPGTNPSIAIAGTQQFTATGIFSSGPTQDLTSSANWSSSTPAVATIAATGNATGVAVGTTTITANYKGIHGSTALNVGLNLLAVSPASATISQGQFQPYTAIGTFSDSSQHNLSNSVNWISSNQPVAIISSSGVAAGLSPGASNIQAASGAVTSSSVPLTVKSPPNLVTLQVSPANSSITLGHNQGFTASAVYDDGSTKTLSNGVAWFTSNPAIATIDPFGIATSVSQGTITITAIALGFSGSAQLIVTPPPTLTTITVTPANAVLGNGKTQQYTAIGHYSDSSTKDLTSLVVWNSSNTNAAVITNAGVAGAVGIGNTTIKATSGAINGSTGLRTLGAPRFAYTVNQTQNTISEYAINGATGALQPMGYALTGAAPTDIAIDQVHNFAWVANSGLGQTSFTNINIPAGNSQFSSPYALTVNTATSKVYVADTGDGTVTRIDPSNNNATKVITIPGGANLYAIAADPATNKIYVADAFQSKVFVIDGSTDTISATISTGLSGPIAIAILTTTTPNKIYVANQNDGSIDVIDGTTDAVITTVKDPSAGQASGIDVNPNTNKIYCVGTTGVTVINGSVTPDTDAAFVVDPDPHAIGPIAIAVNATTNKIYVANAGNANTIFGSVTEIDGATNNTFNIVDPSADGPYAVAVNPVTNKIYVGNAFTSQAQNLAPSVTVIDGATHSTTNLPGAYGNTQVPIAVDPNTNTIFVPNFSASMLEIIDGASNKVTPLTVTGASNQHAVAVNPGTNNAYVANEGSGNVTVLAQSTNTPSNTISAYSVDPSFGTLAPLAASSVTVGNAPVSVAVDPAGRFLYAVNSADNNVSGFTINTANGNLTSTGTPTSLSGTNPFKISVDSLGRFAYITYENSNRISQFTINQLNGVLAGGTDTLALANVNAFIVDPAGQHAYAVDSSNNVEAYSVNQVTGALTPTTPATFATGVQPESVSIDPAGHFLYTCNTGDSTISIFAINPANGNLTPATTPTIGPFGSPPVGMTIDPSGRFAIFGEQGDNQAIEVTIDPTTGALSFLQEFHIRPAVGGLITGGAPLASVANFAYIKNAFSNNISAFTVDPAGGDLTPVAGSPFATGGVDSNGQCSNSGQNCNVGDSVVVSDPLVRYAYLPNSVSLNISGFTINRSNGVLTPLSGSPFTIGASAGDFVRGSALDPSGRFLWMGVGTDSNCNPTCTNGPQFLYGFAVNLADGSLAAIPGSPISLGNNSSAPRSLAYDPTGQFLYVLFNGSLLAYSVDINTGSLTPISGSPYSLTLNSPKQVSVTPNGKFLFIPDKNGFVAVYSIDSITGALSQVSGSPFIAPAYSQQVAFDALSQFAYIGAANDQAFVNNLGAYTISQSGSLSSLGAPVANTGFITLGTAPGTQFLYSGEAFLPNGGTDQLLLYHTDPTTGLFTLANAIPTGGSGSLGPVLTGIYAAQPPHLLLVTLTVQNASIPQGVQQQLTATGVFSDGSTQDFTSSAIWTSSNSNILSVSPSGLALGVAQGTVAVTASVQGVSGSASIAVTGVSLQSISITPASASLPQNSTLQFVATGSFSDGSTQDISQSVAWFSSNQAAVTINGSGLATATGSTGSSNISAVSGTISSAASVVSVHPVATLSSVTVSPTSFSLPLAASVQFFATAHYSDGSAPDVTDLATWNSGTPSVAVISNNSGTRGLATSMSAGTTAITATFNAVPSAPSTLTVAKKLVSLAITPSSAFLPLSHTVQFAATGTYSDGSTQNITSSVIWTSSNTNIVTINSSGLATGKGIGNASVTATLNGVSNSASVSGVF